MKLQLVHIDQVKGYISSLKRGKSLGLDGISHEHLIYRNLEALCSRLAALYIAVYTIYSIRTEIVYY